MLAIFEDNNKSNLRRNLLIGLGAAGLLGGGIGAGYLLSGDKSSPKQAAASPPSKNDPVVAKTDKVVPPYLPDPDKAGKGLNYTVDDKGNITPGSKYDHFEALRQQRLEPKSDDMPPPPITNLLGLSKEQLLFMREHPGYIPVQGMDGMFRINDQNWFDKLIGRDNWKYKWMGNPDNTFTQEQIDALVAAKKSRVEAEEDDRWNNWKPVGEIPVRQLGYNVAINRIINNQTGSNLPTTHQGVYASKIKPLKPLVVRPYEYKDPDLPPELIPGDNYTKLPMDRYLKSVDPSGGTRSLKQEWGIDPNAKHFNL